MPEDLEEQIIILKNEIERLENEIERIKNAIDWQIYQPNCMRCDAWGGRREPVCRACGALAPPPEVPPPPPDDKGKGKQEGKGKRNALLLDPIGLPFGRTRRIDSNRRFAVAAKARARDVTRISDSEARMEDVFSRGSGSSDSRVSRGREEVESRQDSRSQ